MIDTKSGDLDAKTVIQNPSLNAIPADHTLGKLPPELMNEVWQYFTDSEDKGLLSEEEAKEHRLKLMKMRSAHAEKSEDMWHQHTYSFCEH